MPKYVLRTPVTVVAIALALAACAAGNKVNVDYDQVNDFSNYQSFTWLSENPMKVGKALKDVEGAYSVLVLTEKYMIGARDPMGFRPLVFGRLKGADLTRLRAQVPAL